MIQSVSKAMQLLSVISDSADAPVTLKSMSERTGIPKSTCAHIVSSLLELGYLQQISHNEGYVLGPLVYYLTRYGKYEEQLVRVCDPMLRWLRGQIGHTTLLTIIRNQRKFIIHYVEGDKKLSEKKTDIILGNIFSTATGRVLLASMDRRDVLELYKKYSVPESGQWPEARSTAALFDKLGEIKRDGYAYVYQLMGGRPEIGYACEIHDAYKTLGAVGVAVPGYTRESDISPDEHSLIIEKLRVCAREINRRLRFETDASGQT